MIGRAVKVYNIYIMWQGVTTSITQVMKLTRNKLPRAEVAAEKAAEEEKEKEADEKEEIGTATLSTMRGLCLQGVAISQLNFSIVYFFANSIVN